MHFAGIGLEKKFVNTSLDDWNKIISVNLTGSFLMIKEIKINIKVLFFVIFGSFLISKYYLFDYMGLAHEIHKGNYEFFKIEDFFKFVNFERIALISKYILYERRFYYWNKI